MTHELHQQILTGADDQVYNVYADWLEQHGDLARADLIRAQLETARLPAWDRRAVEASWRARGLLARHAARWRAELPELDGIVWTDFARGFVTAVKARDVATLYRHAAAIAKAAPVSAVELEKLDESVDAWIDGSVPWLRTLRIAAVDEPVVHATSSILSAAREIEVRAGEWAPLLDEMLRSRDGAPLDALVVRGPFTFARSVENLVGHAGWRHGLARLHLGTRWIDYDTGYYQDPTLGGEGALALGAAKLDALADLNIDRQRVGPDGFDVLLRGLPALRSLSARACDLTSLDALRHPGAPLDELDVGENAFRDAGARAIAASPRTAQLARLGAATCEIGPAGLAALVASPVWDALRELDLSRNPLGPAGADELVRARRPTELHTLGLADADLDGDALARLAALPWVRGLLALDLAGNACGAALTALADCRVRALDIGGIGWAGAGADRLAGLWHGVVHLHLANNQLGEAFAGIALGPELHTLDVDACGLGDAAIDHVIAAAPPKLRAIVFSRNRPSAAALARLLASPVMAGLDVLDLSRCGLDLAAAHVIAAAPGVAHLDQLNLRHNAWEEDSLLALARSPHLRTVRRLRLTGESWSYEESTRDELLARFGSGWGWDWSDPPDGRNWFGGRGVGHEPDPDDDPF